MQYMVINLVYKSWNLLENNAVNIEVDPGGPTRNTNACGSLIKIQNNCYILLNLSTHTGSIS